MKLTTPIQPPDESCNANRQNVLYSSPLAAGPEGRLSPSLRPTRYITATNGADVVQMLKDAAAELPHDRDLGLRMADLAVTGTIAYESFRRAHPQDHDLGGTEAAREVLDRAYAVAWYLRGWAPRQFAGADLGWIAVSGEDDPPHRPVNVSASAWPQHDVAVRVGNVTVRVRYIVASGTPPARIDATARARARELPPETQPARPAGRILLFLHGHSSRIEESDDVLPYLTGNSPFSVIAFDFPGSAYSSFIEPVTGSSAILEHTMIGPVPPANNKLSLAGFPILEFYERFLCSLVETLGTRLGFDPRAQFASVMGGSLGGNMGLRLANLAVQQAHPWLWNVVSWSPASVWEPLTGVLAQLGPEDAYDRMVIPETTDYRTAYFKNLYIDDHALGLLKPQPQYWYRDGWPCKEAYIQASRVERQETYHERYRRWHYRVAYEQLLFSHRSADRIANMCGRTMLITGERDVGGALYVNAVIEANELIDTPGNSRFLRDTGHSIHNERPGWLASTIKQFVAPPEPAVSAEEPWDGWVQSVPPLAGATDLTVKENVDGRLEVFSIAAQGGHQRVFHAVQSRPDGRFGAWGPLATTGVPGDANFFGRVAVGENADGRLEAFARCHWGDGRVLVSSVDSIAKVFQKSAGSWAGAEWDCGNETRQFIGGWPLESPAVISHVGVADPLTAFEQWIGRETGGIAPGTSAMTRYELCAALIQPHKPGHGTAIHIRGANRFGWWTEGKTLGNQALDLVDTPVLARHKDGRLTVFARVRSGNVYQISETKAYSDNWASSWEDLGGVVTGPIAVARRWDGVLEVFGRGADGALWHRAESGGWASLGGNMVANGRPHAVMNAWGGISVFVRFADLTTRYRRSNRTGAWSDWFSLAGGCKSDPVVVARLNGVLQVFVVGGDSAVYARRSFPGTYTHEDPRPVTPGVANRLSIEIRTGGDDLRKNSQATAYVRLRSGQEVDLPLNNGQAWGNHSVNTRSLDLPAGAHVHDIGVFGIRFVPGKTNPLDTPDNWNVDAVKVSFAGSDGAGTLLDLHGSPLVRFTNQKREWSSAVG